MARIQILHLPSHADGDTITPRYALVVDESDLSDDDCEAVRSFAAALGAECLIVAATLDVTHGDDDAVDDAMLAGLRDLMAPIPDEKKPKLPPADTIEGKMARVWGGPTVRDPRDV